MTRLCLITIGVLIFALFTSAREGEGQDRNISEELGSPGTEREKRGTRKEKRRGEKRGKRGNKKRDGKNKTKQNLKKNRNQTGSRKTSRAFLDSCFAQVLTIMRMWKDVITNSNRQRTKMLKQKRTGGSKTGKMGVFNSVYQVLLSAGGGDKTRLTCAGRTDSPGAAQLTNLTSTLSSCQTDISSACDPSTWPQPNMTKVEMCEELVTRFTTGAQECLDLSFGVNKADTDTACACWTNSRLAETVKSAKVCKFPTESKGGYKAYKK